MSATARGVRFLVPLLLFALALLLIFNTAAPQAMASDASVWHEAWSNQTNAFSRAVDVQSATTAPDHPVVQALATPVLQQAAADYPGENAKLWEDALNPDTMLDLASLVLSVSPDRTQIRVDVFLFEPFNGYHLGPQFGYLGDAAWIQLDTDMNPYTGTRHPLFGEPRIGYDYLLSFKWDTSVGWHIDIYRTPSYDVEWYVVGSFSVSQSSNGTYSHLETEFALSSIGRPSGFDFLTYTSYQPPLGRIGVRFYA